MVERRPDRGHRPALQDLHGPLRDALQQLLDQPISEQATQRAVERYVALGTRRAKRRVAGRLWLAGALATGAVAALLSVLALRDPALEEASTPVHELASLPSDREPPPDEPLTLQKYRLALRESPEAMVRLLDQHASTFSPPSGQPLRIGPRAWRDFVERQIGEEL